jgi:hypothetical protein
MEKYWKLEITNQELKFIDILYCYFCWHLNDIKLIIYPIILMSKPCLLFIGVNKTEKHDR